MKVLFEDRDIIVCVKEPGVPIQSDKSRDKDMVNALRNYVVDSENGCYKEKGIPYIGLVHRLDRPVGGVVVFAKTPKALKELNRQLTQGIIKKRYLAIVKDKGNNIKDKGDEWICLEDYLLKNGRENVSNVVDEGTQDAKKAILYYRLVKRVNDMVMFEIKLITGRHHQIRVQMANQGMPLIGDTKYNSSCDKGQVMLFSYCLSFNHPITNKCVTFEYKPDYGEFKLFNNKDIE